MGQCHQVVAKSTVSALLCRSRCTCESKAFSTTLCTGACLRVRLGRYGYTCIDVHCPCMQPYYVHVARSLHVLDFHHVAPYLSSFKLAPMKVPAFLYSEGCSHSTGWLWLAVQLCIPLLPPNQPQARKQWLDSTAEFTWWHADCGVELLKCACRYMSHNLFIYSSECVSRIIFMFWSMNWLNDQQQNSMLVVIHRIICVYTDLTISMI